MIAYKWKPGSFHGRTSAQVAGEVCGQLEAEGRLNAETLVEVSRPEDAPLHGEFNWDDEAAAEEWRKHQARHLINSIEIVVETREPVRAFYTLERKSSAYTSIMTIKSQPGSYQLLLKQARSELAAFRRKYRQIAELGALFEAIDRILGEQGA